MTRVLLAAMSVSLLLGACGTVRDSRLNPFNWFGRSQSAPATLAPADGYAPVSGDNRALVDQVTAMEVKRIPGGAIVQASGLPVTQGWWDAGLVAENDGAPDENGALSFRFVVAEPRSVMPVSTPQSREVTAGTYLSDQALDGVSRIVVLGARNSRIAGR